MTRRYLIALNIFQRAFLNGVDERSPDSFYLRSVAQFIRRRIIRLYMLRDDYENARNWLNRPILRDNLAQKAPALLSDLEYVLRNVFVKEMEVELYDYARSFSTLLSMDSLRLAAASLLKVDGIVSMEPEDFVQDSDDIKEIRKHGKGFIFLENAESEDGSRDRIYIFVATPYSFLIQLDNDFGEESFACNSIDGNSESFRENNCPKLNLHDWGLTTGMRGITAISLTLSYCAYFHTHRQLIPKTGEVDSLFLAINSCARALLQQDVREPNYLPEFHTSYTSTSAQGLPGLINVEVGLSYLDRNFQASRSGKSTLDCTLNVYIDALNKVIQYAHTRQDRHQGYEHEHSG